VIEAATFQQQKQTIFVSQPWSRRTWVSRH